MFSVYTLVRMHFCTGLLCLRGSHTTFKLMFTAPWIQLTMHDVVCMVTEDSFCILYFLVNLICDIGNTQSCYDLKANIYAYMFVLLSYDADIYEYRPKPKT